MMFVEIFVHCLSSPIKHRHNEGIGCVSSFLSAAQQKLPRSCLVHYTVGIQYNFVEGKTEK